MRLGFRVDEEEDDERGGSECACEHENRFRESSDRRGVKDTEDERL